MQPESFVPPRTTTMTNLMPVVFLVWFEFGYFLKLAGSCKLFCSDDLCVTLNQQSADFHTAGKACRETNGELLMIRSEKDVKLLDAVSKSWTGNIWVGLRLPPGACSNISAPLRGYEWTAVKDDRTVISLFPHWTNSVELCSPHCVSLSKQLRWTERLCSDKIDGFLCKSTKKDACLGSNHPQEAVFFKSTDTCKSAPCEHNCKDVQGGYECSCFKGFAPKRGNQRRCGPHCAGEKCPKLCRLGECSCPTGYVEDEDSCVDIDECDSNWCDHHCANTFGGYVCSCRDGYVLGNKDKCIKVTDISVFTTQPVGVVEPASKSATMPHGTFLWLWVVAAVAVVVAIFAVRYYIIRRHRHGELNFQQQTASPANNNEC